MRIIGLALLSATALFGIDQAQLTQQQIDDIIQKFAAKETAFAQARENYTYKQSAKIQTLDEGGIQRAPGSRFPTSCFHPRDGARSTLRTRP